MNRKNSLKVFFVTTIFLFLFVQIFFAQNEKDKIKFKPITEPKTQKADSATSAPKQIQTSKIGSSYKEKTIYVIGKYHNYLDNLIKEEIIERKLLNVSDAESIFNILADLCFKDNPNIKIGNNDFNIYQYSLTLNKVILAKLNGKYTNADMALKVAEILDKKIRNEIITLNKKIKDPTYLSPEEIEELKERNGSEIYDRKGDIEIIEEDLSSLKDDLDNLSEQKKILLLQLKKVMSILKDEQGQKKIEMEIAENKSVPDEVDLKEAMSDVDNLSAQDAIEEQSFIYAQISEIDYAIMSAKDEIKEKQKKSNILNQEIKILQDQLKSPKKDIKPEEKEKLIAEYKDMLKKKEEQLAKQEALIPQLKINLENRKKELELSLKTVSPEIIDSVDRQMQNIDLLFKKLTEYQYKADIVEKKRNFQKAFDKKPKSSQQKDN